MIFSKLRHAHLVPPITVGGDIIEYVETFNFLGFVFHKKLSLKHHVNYISQRSFKFVNVIRSLCAVSWGSDPYCLIQLYVGLIRPRLEYMSPLLLSCNDTDFLKLQRIQWKCLRVALGAMQSTHTLSLEQMANIMPLPERLKYITNCIVGKILSDGKHPARQFLFDLVNHNANQPFVNCFSNKITNFDIRTFNIDPTFSQPYESLFSKAVVKFLLVKKNSTTSQEVCSLFSKYVCSKWKNFKLIFTDGSKSQQSVGCGIWFPDIDIEAYFPLHSESSVYTSEAMTII